MRFEREAKTLASLNHPQIAQIFGIEEQPAEPGFSTTEASPKVVRRAIVMELVEGEDHRPTWHRQPAAGKAAAQRAEACCEKAVGSRPTSLVAGELRPGQRSDRQSCSAR